jgi:hypothetical protein
MASKIGIFTGVGLVVAVAVGVRLAASRPTVADPPPADEPKKPDASIPIPRPTPPRPLGVDAGLDSSVPPAAHPSPKKHVPLKPKPLTQSELLQKLRKAQDTDDYMLSYELAREGQRRFPDSPDAPEIAAMVVKSLARMGKISEARAEAETMVNKYAGTHWAREVERHTGAHPTVNQVPPK